MLWRFLISEAFHLLFFKKWYNKTLYNDLKKSFQEPPSMLDDLIFSATCIFIKKYLSLFNYDARIDFMFGFKYIVFIVLNKMAKIYDTWGIIFPLQFKTDLLLEWQQMMIGLWCAINLHTIFSDWSKQNLPLNRC
jgi:hypothetical protein